MRSPVWIQGGLGSRTGLYYNHVRQSIPPCIPTGTAPYRPVGDMWGTEKELYYWYLLTAPGTLAKYCTAPRIIPLRRHPSEEGWG